MKKIGILVALIALGSPVLASEDPDNPHFEDELGYLAEDIRKAYAVNNGECNSLNLGNGMLIEASYNTRFKVIELETKKTKVFFCDPETREITQEN